ncbi:MAG: 4Fe-4S dicluster domain-containing protein [Gammaproteobacteria bacterium]|nr:4Fe-4S dicluster domain-containing protein [Gammaproteobacteria bacterium]
MKESASRDQDTPSTVNSSRRGFIAGTAALGVATVAPGVFLYRQASAKPADQAVSSAVRWGMLIDTNQLGENDIELAIQACRKEHGVKGHDRPATDVQWIRKVHVKDTENDHVTTLPIMCQHCESPPCADVCPTGASFKRADGIVLVDKHICIGCRYCMMACPYKARSFVHEKVTDQLPTEPRGKGTVEACTMCVHRVDKDGPDAVPACAEAVNQGKTAILFGDLNDPESEISKALQKFGSTQIRADLGLNPGIRYWGI